MNELHRQAYLDAMGVDVYFPRVLLPGAPVSLLCDMAMPSALSEPADDSLSGIMPRDYERAGASVNASQGRAAAMQELLNEIPEATPKPILDSNHAVSNKTELHLRRESVTPRFMLSVTRVGDVVIIDDSPAEDALEFQRLQQNFFLALGLVADIATSNFKWPIVESSHLDQSQHAAKQTLRVFVQNQLKSTPPKALLLMGETAFTYLLDDKPVLGEWLAEFVADVPVLCAPSLVAALGPEQLKQHIWQAIKPLRKKLTE